MTQFVTSDLHFHHTNILTFNPDTRQFPTIDDMNMSMVNEWNSKVSNNDEIFILGDVVFGNEAKAISILDSLNGTKILIEGNHDRKLLKSQKFRSYFDSIFMYYEHSVDKERICMFHYPIHEWNGCYRGAYHFYGHVHGSTTGLEVYRAGDIGMDSKEFPGVVKTIDSVLDALRSHPNKPHHGETE